MTGAVTLCIPVYNGAAFVAATLASALAQTYPHCRLLVSVEPSTDASWEICESYWQNPQVTVVAQPQRLGWVAHCNWLLQQVQTPYFMLLPHDDLIAPHYVAAQLAVLQQHPEAVGSCSAIACLGDYAGVVLPGYELRGATLGRVVEMLEHRFDSIAFRAVFRHLGTQTPLIPHQQHQDYAADTAWILAWAQRGELWCLPEPLYQKRFYPQSTHAQWKHQRDDAELCQMWLDHSAQMTRLALAWDWDAAARGRIREAGLVRALSPLGGMGEERWHPTTGAGFARLAARYLLAWEKMATQDLHDA